MTKNSASNCQLKTSFSLAEQMADICFESTAFIFDWPSFSKTEDDVFIVSIAYA